MTGGRRRRMTAGALWRRMTAGALWRRVARALWRRRAVLGGALAGVAFFAVGLLGACAESNVVFLYVRPSIVQSTAPDAKTTVYYSLRQGVDVTVSVHNQAGKLVRLLVDNLGRDANEQHEDEWDGRDGNGQLVQLGTYYITLSVADRRHVISVIVL